jgi:hypothetical protein
MIRQADMSKYDIYVAFLRPKPILFGEMGIHWSIMIAHPGLEYGTMYHIVRSRRGGILSHYELHVRSFRPLNGDEIIDKKHIATLLSTQIDRFNTILASVPLRDSQNWSIGNFYREAYGYSSEQWTIEVIMALEDLQMVRYGTSLFVEPGSTVF